MPGCEEDAGGAGRGLRVERKEKRPIVLLEVWREMSGREERKEAGSVVPSGDRRVGSTGESVRLLFCDGLVVFRARSSSS